MNEKSLIWASIFSEFHQYRGGGLLTIYKHFWGKQLLFLWEFITTDRRHGRRHSKS